MSSKVIKNTTGEKRERIVARTIGYLFVVTLIFLMVLWEPLYSVDMFLTDHLYSPCLKWKKAWSGWNLKPLTEIITE